MNSVKSVLLPSSYFCCLFLPLPERKTGRKARRKDERRKKETRVERCIISQPKRSGNQMMLLFTGSIFSSFPFSQWIRIVEDPFFFLSPLSPLSPLSFSFFLLFLLFQWKVSILAPFSFTLTSSLYFLIYVVHSHAFSSVFYKWNKKEERVKSSRAVNLPEN